MEVVEDVVIVVLELVLDELVDDVVDELVDMVVVLVLSGIVTSFSPKLDTESLIQSRKPIIMSRKQTPVCA